MAVVAAILELSASNAALFNALPFSVSAADAFQNLLTSFVDTASQLGSDVLYMTVQVRILYLPIRVFLLD